MWGSPGRMRDSPGPRGTGTAMRRAGGGRLHRAQLLVYVSNRRAVSFYQRLSWRPWLSPTGQALPWMRRRSGGSTRRSARPPRSARNGHQGSCRHSFVSLMSSSGLAVEEIARLAGHSSSRTTEVVHRREFRPGPDRGTETMDRLFWVQCASVGILPADVPIFITVRPGIQVFPALVGLRGWNTAAASAAAPEIARPRCRRHAEDALKVCQGCTEWRHGVAVGWHQVSVRPQMATCGISSS